MDQSNTYWHLLTEVTTGAVTALAAIDYAELGTKKTVRTDINVVVENLCALHISTRVHPTKQTHITDGRAGCTSSRCTLRLEQTLR
jgi:hypothetical protein